MSIKALEGLTKLEHNIKVYLPITDTTNGIAGIEDAAETENHITIYMTKLFGGCTIYPAAGIYKADNGEIIPDKLLVCESFTDKVEDDDITTLLLLVRLVESSLRQESVAFEIDRVMYFV